MTEITTHTDPNDALACLLDKYSVQLPGPWQILDSGQPPSDADDMLALAPGNSLTETELPELTVPLLPWRHQRRFVELKRLIDEKTVSPLLMCRFACLTDGCQMSLQAILYREFDLVEWLSGTPIVAIYASMAAGQAANVIVRLADGVVGSVEAGATLPDGTAIQDRHEMIARRGVASDRAVDTQVPQSSVYVWSDSGPVQFTDTDTELLGLDSDSVALVRAAYDALSRPESHDELRREHARLRRLVALAYESDRQLQRLRVEGRPS